MPDAAGNIRAYGYVSTSNAAAKLLLHYAMHSKHQLADVTGWPKAGARRKLQRLLKNTQLINACPHLMRYALRTSTVHFSALWQFVELRQPALLAVFARPATPNAHNERMQMQAKTLSLHVVETCCSSVMLQQRN
jgi:hypothetical protein